MSRRKIFLLLLLAVTSGLAGCYGRRAWHTAADQKLNTNPCNPSEDDAVGLSGDLSIDVGAVHRYGDTVARMLKEEKFEALDCLADRARSSQERFSGGAWKLHALYAALHHPVQFPVAHATEEDWDDLLQQLQKWVAARPKSVSGRIALASAHLGYAAYARGEGDAATVSEGGWKLIREHTAEARRILEKTSALRTKCPEWYVAMQQVAQNQGWNASKKNKLFEKAFKFEPGYQYAGGERAYNLLPKQGGKAGDTERFIQQVADRVGGGQGDILYFQIASSPSLICACDEDPHLSWERIDRGFEASEKQYGVSMVSLNRIAFLASHYGKLDAAVAQKALSRLGEQWDAETWTREEDFESTKEWATRWAPVAAKERLIEAAAEANRESPEGPRYQAAFEKKFRELMQQCALSQGSTVGKLEALTNVGTKGTVEDVSVFGPGGLCVYQKLLTFQGDKTPAFPPPPQAPYWVRLDLDWAEFAPVAAK